MKNDKRHTPAGKRTGDEAARIIDALQDEQLDPTLRTRMQHWLFDEGDTSWKQEAFVVCADRLRPYTGRLDGEARERYNRLAARLGLEQAPEVIGRLRMLRRAPAYWRVAAAVLLPMLVVTSFYFLVGRGPGEFSPWQIASAEYSQAMQLPDSSHVSVHPHTTVVYRESQTERSVELSGEAFFKVKRDELKPFSVQTSHLKVEVLGTHFSVSEFEDGTCASVSLYEGSVRVETNGAVTMLASGERMTYDAATNEANIQIIPAAEMMGGGYKPRLKFDHATFREVINALAARHDVEIEIADGVGLTGGRLTVTLDDVALDEALEVVLRMSSEPVGYRRENEKITLYKK